MKMKTEVVRKLEIRLGYDAWDMTWKNGVCTMKCYTASNNYFLSFIITKRCTLDEAKAMTDFELSYISERAGRAKSNDLGNGFILKKGYKEI
jgi:hypothetical protein